jgi:hypothetical protein
MAQNARYRYKSSGTISAKLICAVCEEPFLDPRTSSCRHRFCFECISSRLQNNSECPTCRAPITLDSLQTDTTLEEFLDELQVFCDNQISGCSWTGARVDFSQHFTQCNFFVCPAAANKGCSWKGAKNAIAEHVDTSCATTLCKFVGCNVKSD